MPAASRFSGNSAIVCAAGLWGTWSLFFRPAERIATVGSAVQSTVIFATMLVVVGPLAWRDRPAAQRPRGVWLLMGVIGVVDAFNILCFFEAMQRTSLAVAVLTHYLALPLVAVTAPRVLGERTRRGAWLALGVALGGLVLLVEPWRSDSGEVLAGAAFGSASAVFFAGNVLGSKQASRRVSPRELLAWRIPTALPVLLLFAPSGGFALPLTVYALIVGAGLLPGVAAALLYYWGLGRVPASRATILSLLEPVVAIGIGAVVWSEIPGPLAALGALLILLALYLTARHDRAA